MRVRLFAALRELAGTTALEVDAPNVGSLLDQLSDKFGPSRGRCHHSIVVGHVRQCF